MANSRFTLSWDSFGHNLCLGFSALQQNGEFVDMTLAAEGHMVKVHQAVAALASPYIKQLIANANCPHPVIFLNNVSFKTLRSILEYVYTGETQISNDEIIEFLEAGKNLCIKGIQDMLWKNLPSSAVNTESQTSVPKKTVSRVQVHEERDSDIPEDANEPEVLVPKSEVIDLDRNDAKSSFDLHDEDEDYEMIVTEQRIPELVRKLVNIPRNDKVTLKLRTEEDKTNNLFDINCGNSLGLTDPLDTALLKKYKNSGTTAKSFSESVLLEETYHMPVIKLESIPRLEIDMDDLSPALSPPLPASSPVPTTSASRVHLNKRALSTAERTRRYREKLKNNPKKAEIMRKKHLEQMKARHKKINEMTDKEKEKYRKRWRDQKRNQRIKKSQKVKLNPTTYNPHGTLNIKN